MKKRKVKVKKKPLFSYLSEDNYSYIKQLSSQTGRSTTYIIETLVEAYRNNKSPVIDIKIPTYVEKAKKWLANNQVLQTVNDCNIR